MVESKIRLVRAVSVWPVYTGQEKMSSNYRKNSKKSIGSDNGGKVRARYGKGEITLNRMRSAAIEEISLRGYHRTSVCEIVKRADLTRGAFYNYWNTLDDCVLDLIQHIEEDSHINPDIKKLQNKTSHPSQIVGTVQILATMVLKKKWREGSLILALLHEKDLPGTPVKKNVKRYIDNRMREWKEHISNDQKAGIIRKELDPQAMALMLLSMIAGVFHQMNIKYTGLHTAYEKGVLEVLNDMLTDSYRRKAALKTIYITN